MMEAEDASREDGTSIAGTLVRLAWHASGTYSKVLHTVCTTGDVDSRGGGEVDWPVEPFSDTPCADTP